MDGLTKAAIRDLALVLARADGEISGNSYAEHAYLAGVDATQEYWNALATSALNRMISRDKYRDAQMDQSLRKS